MTAGAREAAENAWLRFGHTLAGRFVVRLIELRVVDRSLALASKLFIAILPVSILSNSLVSGQGFGDELVERIGLTGEGAHAARTLFASPNEVQAGFGFLGLLILASSVLSFSRALENVYLDCWRLPPSPHQAFRRRLTWLGGFALYSIVLTPMREVIHGSLAERLAAAVLAGLLFLWTPYVLMGRRVSWRRLMPTSVITGGSILIAGVCSAIVMPKVLTQDTVRYGLIGFAFGMVPWLFVISAVLIAAAALGSLIDERMHEGEADGPPVAVAAPPRVGV
jgi:membrane protein